MKETKANIVANFPWGRIVKTHKIGEYTIIEYYPTKYEGYAPIKGKYENTTKFHPYVNDINTNTTLQTLDEAIAYAIAYKLDGAGSRAAEYFIKSIS